MELDFFPSSGTSYMLSRVNLKALIPAVDLGLAARWNQLSIYMKTVQDQI